MKKSLIGLALLGVGAVSASAQMLLVGVDDSAENMYIYDTQNMTAAPTAVGLGVDIWGMAGDNSAGVLYASSGSTLHSFNYYSWTSAGADVALIDSTGAAQAFVSLSFNQQTGKLYGTKNISTEAVWEINPVTGVSTIVYAYPSGDFDFGGTDIDPTTGKMYGTNDDSTPQRGLYEIDYVNGSTTFVSDYPAGETDIDGLGVGYGKAYLLEDDSSATGKIYIYDFASNTYDSVATPWAGSEVFAGATVIPNAVPEPATMIGIGTLALLALRRKNKK